MLEVRMESNETLANDTFKDLTENVMSEKDLILTVWSVILIFIGVSGNLLTLIAIPFAKWKNQ